MNGVELDSADGYYQVMLIIKESSSIYGAIGKILS